MMEGREAKEPKDDQSRRIAPGLDCLEPAYGKSYQANVGQKSEPEERRGSQVMKRRERVREVLLLPCCEEGGERPGSTAGLLVGCLS